MVVGLLGDFRTFGSSSGAFETGESRTEILYHTLGNYSSLDRTWKREKMENSELATVWVYVTSSKHTFIRSRTKATEQSTR